MSEVNIEIRKKKRFPFVVSPVLSYSCFKRCILVHSVPQNVEVEPLRTKSTCCKVQQICAFNCPLVVGRATGYGLDDRGVEVRVPAGSRIISSPSRPYRFWGPPSLLSNGYRRLFLRAWGWPLTSNYCQGQENVDLYIHSPIHLHGVAHRDNFTSLLIQCYDLLRSCSVEIMLRLFWQYFGSLVKMTGVVWYGIGLCNHSASTRALVKADALLSSNESVVQF
jgi:hypothetical protein